MMVFHRGMSLAEQYETEKGEPKHGAVPFGREMDDPELVKRAQNDDSWAADQLLRRYYEKAYGIVYRMCNGDAEEAADLVQESFFKAFRNLKKFKGDASFYTWLYRIVINTCLDGRRRKQRRKGIFSLWRPRRKDGEEMDQPLEKQPDPKDSANPLSSFRGKQLQKQVLSALGALSDKQRMAFELKVFEDMTIGEVAKVMGAAEGTVKTHLFRATQHVRQTLSEWTEP